MFFNPNVCIAIFIGILLFTLGDTLGSNAKRRSIVAMLLIAGIVMVLPALSFGLYYVHVIDEPIWYIEYRSIPYIEILSGFSGFLFGLLSKTLSKIRTVNIHQFLYFLIAMLFCIVPFIKPIVLPVKLFSNITNTWVGDVCMQSTPSTCGPCSAATILKYYGINITEEEIARNSYTAATGTEIWYLIRYLRNIDFDVRLHKIDNIFDVPTPAIVGTKVGWAGHFIALLDIQDDKLVIGDSLVGELVLTREEFNERYTFEHFVFEIVQG